VIKKRLNPSDEKHKRETTMPLNKREKILSKALLVFFILLSLSSFFLLLQPHDIPTVRASPDTLTLRPNAAGYWQEWSTFGTGTTHWDRTSDQSDDTGVQVTGSTTLKETENLADTSQTGTINSITGLLSLTRKART